MTPLMVIFFKKVNFLNSEYFYVSEKTFKLHKSVRTYTYWIDEYNFPGKTRNLVKKLNES